jgi:hypothetical protein
MVLRVQITPRKGEKMKGLNLRMPDEILKWVREKAARETIAKGERVSMNIIILDLLKREMEADRKEG